MEILPIEHYHQLKINFSYNDPYLDGEYDFKNQMNEMLLDWLKKEQPVSYRLLNAQTLFIDQVEMFGSVWPPIIQEILHISFIKR